MFKYSHTLRTVTWPYLIPGQISSTVEFYVTVTCGEVSRAWHMVLSGVGTIISPSIHPQSFLLGLETFSLTDWALQIIWGVFN